MGDAVKSVVSRSSKSFFTSSSRSVVGVLAIFLVSCVLVYLVTSFKMVFNESDCGNLLVYSRISASTSLENVVFGIASTKSSLPKQMEYMKAWWKPEKMRGCVYLDVLPTPDIVNAKGLPSICVSQDTSRFRYTYKHGYRSLIRVARIVSETVNLNHTGVQWYVFGDGDTVFFTDNLVKTLSKYDHELWYYIGSNSEIYEQNIAHSFDMAFWGAGFAVSAPLAKLLAKVFDSCLERYHHLFGSDGRVYSCLAELGVGLTREPGFHQVDVRGNIFGLLAAHPMTPVVSLSRLEEVDPIFPNMTATAALHHLFKSASVDSERVLQQTVCYDRWFSWTISVSWGYAVEIFDHHIYMPDVIRAQDTFSPWKKGAEEAKYTFNSRPLHPDPCRRSTIFFLHSVSSRNAMITSSYRRALPDNCTYDPMASPKKLQEVVVFSQKSTLSMKQLLAPRRQCCDVLPPTTAQKIELSIRECREEELIRI